MGSKWGVHLPEHLRRTKIICLRARGTSYLHKYVLGENYFKKKKTHPRQALLTQGSLHYQPKQCACMRELVEIYHIFAWLDPSKIDSLTTLVTQARPS